MTLDPEIHLLSQAFDYSATLLWALSGALIGARKGYAPLGMLVLALVSSTGGGLLRDGFFLQNGPPALLRTPIYMDLAVSATAIILFFGKYVRRLVWFDALISVVDTIGAGLYAVVGMNMALEAALPMPAVVLIGMVNALGGGILRDVLIRAEPDLFKPGIPYALIVLAGCVLFAILHFTSISQANADLTTIAAVILLRILLAVFGVETRPLSAFEDDWNNHKSMDETRK